MSAKRFRIAFSFAGEKRAYVAQVAAILAQRFGEAAILYDKYHEAEFARYDLGIHLPKLYRDQSDLIVAVLCKDYDVKLWTGWEWMAIHAQLNKNEGAKISAGSIMHTSTGFSKMPASSNSIIRPPSKPPRSSSNASP